MINKEDWEKKIFNDIFSVITDGTHQTPTYTEDTVNGFKFLSSKDVVGGSINWSKIKYIPESLHNQLYARLAPQRNDILLAKNGTTGVCALVDTDDIFDIYVSLALLRPKTGFNVNYLVRFINSPSAKRQFNSHLKGVGVPNLHLSEIRKTKINIPPLPIQQQIVSELDALSNIITKKKKQLEELDKLAQATFYNMFGDPVSNEKGWEMKTLQETVSIDCPISYGIVQPGEEIESGLPIVRPVDLVDTYVSIEKLKRINSELANSYKKTTLRGNEILICVRGTTGAMSLSTPELIGCNVTRGLVPLFFDNHDRLFVYHLLKTPQIQQIISEKTYGIALKQINLSELRKIRLILPPVNVQSLFVKKIEAVHNQKQLISKSIDDVQQLFDFTMDKYFN